MTGLPFDPELLVETTFRMHTSARADMVSLANSHGGSFAMSVMGNLGLALLTDVLAAAEDNEARKAMLMGMLVTLTKNLSVELHEVAQAAAQKQADEAIQKAKAV